jgi:hypothetical protein
MAEVVDEDDLEELWDTLTDLVEGGSLGFPRPVVAELGVIARGEPVQGWAAGLGTRLNSYSANIKYNRPLMGYAADLGYEYGFESLDGKDPSIISVGRLGCQYATEGTDFVIVTEDRGPNPLRPTMEDLATVAGWNYVNAGTCMQTLGCDHLIA